MKTHKMSKSTYGADKQMAADGLGWENIKVELGVSEQVAKIIVLGKYSVRKA